MLATRKILGSVKYYFMSMWNVIDVAAICVYIVCIWQWTYILILAQSVTIAQKFDFSGPEAIGDLLTVSQTINESAAALRTYLYMSIASLSLILLRFFKYTRFQGRLNVINGTFAAAGENLFHFMIVFTVILVMFAIIGKATKILECASSF